MRIRIQQLKLMRIHADPDPKLCLEGGAEEGGAGPHRLQPDLLLFRVEVGICAVPHKLQQAVALKIEGAQRAKAQDDGL